MKKNMLFIASVLMLIVACEYETEEDTPVDVANNVELRFDVSFEGQEFELFENYQNVQGDSMSFEQVKMYLADIRLVKSGGEEVLLSEIEYFNFDGSVQQRYFDVEAGNYEKIIYHVGVPVEMNGTENPDFLTNQFGAAHPLNIQNGMYWAWASGYRFLIYEGRVDTTPDIPNDIPATFSIHIGKDALYSEVEVEEPFSIVNNEMRILDLNWDLGKTLYHDGDTLDLHSSSESQWHGEDLELGDKFRTRMIHALTLDIQ